jgi:hypothetical protein
MVFRRLVAALVAACMFSLGLQTASAGVIGTQAWLDSGERATQLASVRAALAREDVRAALVGLGVDPSAATERAASLSDRELAQVAGQLAELPAGGDGFLAVIGIVFIVLLILELTGVTDIFKKV